MGGEEAGGLAGGGVAVGIGSPELAPVLSALGSALGGLLGGLFDGPPGQARLNDEGMADILSRNADQYYYPQAAKLSRADALIYGQAFIQQSADLNARDEAHDTARTQLALVNIGQNIIRDASARPVMPPFQFTPDAGRPALGAYEGASSPAAAGGGALPVVAVALLVLYFASRK